MTTPRPAPATSHRAPVYWLSEAQKADIRASFDMIEVIARRHGISVADVVRVRYPRQISESQRFAL